jgi:hypothetical protein
MADTIPLLYAQSLLRLAPMGEEGTSFQQLKDQCRKNAAVGYPGSGHYTSAQLSELMGFSDSSTLQLQALVSHAR